MSNICEICGGIKNLVYLVEAVPKDTAVTINADSVPPSKSWDHLCYGHPTSVPWHDGKLGGDGRYQVFRTGFDDGARVDIEGNTNSVDMEDMVSLTPKQALSLLSWLKQERAELTALAEGQEE